MFHLATMHKLHASLILHENSVRNSKACRSELSKLSYKEGSCLPNTSIVPHNGVHKPLQAQARGQECPAEVGQGARSAQWHTVPRLASHMAAYWPERHCTLQEHKPHRERVTPQNPTVQMKPWLLHEVPCLGACNC